MSVDCLSWAFKLTDDRLSSSQKFVLVALANYADEDGSCFPSIRLLARMTGLKDRAVQYAIRALEECGYLTTEMRTRVAKTNGADVPTSSRYVLHRDPVTPGASGAPGVVHDVHPGGAPGAPQEPKKNLSPSNEGGEAAQPPASSKSKKGREVPMPEDWAPNEKHAELAAKRGLVLDDEVDAFKSWTSAKGQWYIDWDGAFKSHLYRQRPAASAAVIRATPPLRELRRFN